MIIPDVVMPGMDGYEVVLWLAQQKSTARLIIVTGARTHDRLTLNHELRVEPETSTVG